MLRTSRIFCLLLALLLAGNALALAGHVNVHGQAKVEQCLLCASHVNPHSAVPAHEHWVSDTYQRQATDSPQVAEPLRRVALIRPRPRGPPSAP